MTEEIKPLTVDEVLTRIRNNQSTVNYWAFKAIGRPMHAMGMDDLRERGSVTASEELAAILLAVLGEFDERVGSGFVQHFTGSLKLSDAEFLRIIVAGGPTLRKHFKNII